MTKMAEKQNREHGGNFGKGVKKLKTLVAMQLKDKLDMSFLRSKKSLLIKSVLAIAKFVIAVIAFYAVFMVCNLLSIFYPVGYIPDTAVNVLFTLIQIMSVITCTLGLTKALYMTQDNKVLLTFPVSSTSVYISKLILYYIFELRKNFGLTLPLLLAYGMINSAVWYYYIWILVCFLIISLIPVAIGSVLSIPVLFFWQFIKSFKWLQAILASIGIAAVIFVVVKTILLIPENINIMGQWYSITLGVRDFLDSFAKIFAPFYYVTLMMVGGTLRIGGVLFKLDTLLYFAVIVGSVAVLLAISFLVARPMFVWMASKQFEFEKRVIPPKKNKVFPRRLSPFMESLNMDFRDGAALLGYITQLFLPTIATLLLNKVYDAMYTNYSGLIMTKAFNFLVMLVMTLAFNNAFANVYSREGAARDILKVRPQSPVYTLISRIALRSVVILISTLGVMITYLQFSQSKEVVLMAVITFLVAEAHLLWCADMDIMNNNADQFRTVGVFDSPNERNATIIGFLLAAFFAFLYYFFRDRGTYEALLKCLAIAIGFAALRIYLFIMRSKLYFKEK